MRPVCLLDRTKNLHQFDGLHFISDSLDYQRRRGSPLWRASALLLYMPILEGGAGDV